MKELKDIVSSKTFKIILATLLVVFFAAIFFSAGVFVGFHKAGFSQRWEKNYEHNFMGGPAKFGPQTIMSKGGRGLRSGHGVMGAIISISGNSIMVKDNEGKENAVQISEKTIINKGDEAAGISDLKENDRIAVIGRPNEEAAIDAKLIHIFPNQH